MFDFDIYSEHTYRCTCVEEEITEHTSHYHHWINDQTWGERVGLYSKNIYEFFTDNTLIEEVSEEEFFKRLKEETGIENIEQLPNLSADEKSKIIEEINKIIIEKKLIK